MTLIAPTRTLIVGSGGREHALAWKLASEPGGNDVFVTPGNAGMADLPRVTVVPADRTMDPSLVDLARRLAVELVVVGPEAELADGIVDALAEAGIVAFGPTRAAARIETSKSFCREVAEASGVPMALGRTFTSASEARAYARRLVAEPGSAGVVVKADGLAGGKGVTVCRTAEEAVAAIDGLNVADSVVVEQRLVGREASVIAICDGRTAIALPAARDHKRALDDDHGPNTGGMGAYSPLPDVPDALLLDIVDRFHRPVLRELARRGSPFRGALYAGVMLTADGPKLLEFNARFGDPETQVILPRLGGALGPFLLAAAKGDLHEALRQVGDDGRSLPTIPRATVGVVIAGGDYPAAPTIGERITGLDDARAAGALVFHSGTRRPADGSWETNGGRIVTVVGEGSDIAAAKAAADAAADLIGWPGARRRHDIGADRAAVVA